MSTRTETSLRVTRVIRADRDAVFRAWTEPAHLRQWSCPVGATVDLAEVDLVVGGQYRIRMSTPNGVHTAKGVYRTIDRPRRLVYTWDWEEKDYAVGETLVTVEFNAVGESTEVVVTHERFPGAQARDGHGQGWTSCLDQLEKLFA
ncbi:MAG: SRPBCC domain-containing protein [Gemmatimonadetes bacterium]|nr:SRPBCC domain-containing protein [Gemmatimonadota bacterium]